MKNLSLYYVSAKRIAVDSENFELCYGHSEGSAGEVFVCSHNLLVTKFDENKELAWCTDLSDVSPTGNLPLNISYLTLTDTLFVGLSGGELITVTNSGTSRDLAGIIGDGLLAAEWSPDQELLVLVTKEFDALLLSCTFDIMQEVKLLKEEFGEKQFITVGWGKKETQFHGSEGKQAAKTKDEVVADPNIKDDTVKITWRGDGQLFAVGFSVDGIRRFKVFDREGHLQYTSEKQQGLEANLCWRPSGNVIASTQKLQDQYEIAFFEKNGLKHGGFTVPVNATTTVKDMTWSSDSEVLALVCFDKSTSVNSILVFTTSNYHWYLKQTLTFDCEQVVSKVLWDNDFDVANNKRLLIFLKSGEQFSYNWVWSVDHSVGRTDGDDAVVAVIDGKRVLLTGFRQTVVPPPMCAFEIELESQVNSIHFSPHTKDSNTFFVSTVDELVFFEQTSKFPLKYEKTKTIAYEKSKFPFQCYSWYWLNENAIVCVRVDGDAYNVLEYEIAETNLTLKADALLPSSVAKVALHPNNSGILYLHTSEGEIIEYRGGQTIPNDYSFPTPCPKFSVLSIENEVHFLGLSHKGNFYIDDALVMNNVNSFFVHTHFLLLTTLSHAILCAELTTAGLNAIREYKTNESAHIYKRKVERGSKLVIAVPNDTRTVLQMPRGNLEAIQPRPLSLKIIGEYLDNLKYHEAFDLMRKQRINLNLIYDHDPDKFLKHVDVFLENIKNNSWLSLFLSDLENVDVTKTMYSSSYADRSNVHTHDPKIEKICDVIREHLRQREDCDTKVLPLLTSYVKKNSVEDLEHALAVIKKMKDNEIAGSKLPVGSDEALKYLLYMVDVNTLFDVALGMYDFELVLLVANKSQKDPKEFVPMLNEFNEMEENFKRFSVNKHLKRFDRAVECLAKCGAEKYGELRTFVKYHSLYRKALELFNPDEEVYKEMSDDFGAYLKLKKQFLEAGIVYGRAKSYEKAVECYKEALEWEMALELANAWDKEKLMQLCSELVAGLKEEKRHKEALSILEEYHERPDDAISYAVECGHYRTALRLCSKFNKVDLRETILKSLLVEYKNLSELIETNWSTFIRHRERLRTVREMKTKQPVEMYDASYNNRDSDLYSDAGSTIASSASRSSSKTFRSSKNRRKHERKLASLKEGSQYEDVALIMALHSLVTSSHELRPQVREMIVALSCFGRNEEAFLLQKSLDKLLKDMKDSFKNIWTNELVLEATNASIAALDIPEGSSVLPQGIATLEPHLRIAPVIPAVNWKLEGLN